MMLWLCSSAQVPAAAPAAKVVTVPAAAPAPVPAAAPVPVDLQCKAVRGLYAAVGTVDTRVSNMLSVHCCDLSDVRCNNVREPAAHGPTHSTHTALLTRACPTTQLADMTHTAPAGGWGAPGTFDVERVKLRGGASKPSGTLPSAASIWDGLKSLSELDLGKDSKSDLSGTIPPAIAALTLLGGALCFFFLRRRRRRDLGAAVESGSQLEMASIFKRFASDLARDAQRQMDYEKMNIAMQEFRVALHT